MIDFVGLRRYFLVLSLAVLLPCFAALALWQLEPGIDFEGGLEIEVRFLRDVSTDEIEAVVVDTEISDVTVRRTDDGTFVFEAPATSREEAQGFGDRAGEALTSELAAFNVVDFTVDDEGVTSEFWFPADVLQDDVRYALRTVDLPDARIQATAESSFKIRVQERSGGTLQTLREEIDGALQGEIGPLFVLQAAAVSGILSSEIAQDAAIALVIAGLAILAYISFAFRRLPTPLLYGSAAIVALLHDITIVVGVFSILGRVADLEVNAMFITALLATIGYSVNDTIVVFDRIRENQLENPDSPLRSTVNAAVTQSLGRSLNTSITLVLALLALVLIGGVTVQPLILVLLVGVIAGTYSSIAVAAQIVVLWSEGSIQRLFGLRRTPADARLTP